MLRVSINDLVSSNVAHIRHQNLLAQEINKRLNALGHLLWVLVLFVILQQAREIKVWICHLEALDVKGMLEEHPHIINLLLLAEVLPDFIS